MYLDLVVVEHFTDKISFNTRAWTHTHTHTRTYRLISNRWSKHFKLPEPEI